MLFGLLVAAGDAIPPANVSIGGGGCGPEGAFLLGRRDGQMALDVQADRPLDVLPAGVLGDDQLAKFGFQSFVQRVLVGFELAAIDVFGRLQLRRMHPGAVDRCHRFGFLAFGRRLLVVTFGQQRRDDGVDLLGDETKFLAQFVERLRLHVFRW